MTIKTELRKFAECTGVKGVSRVFKADSVEIRLLWGIAIIACCAFAFYQAFDLISGFASYSKVMQIQERRIHANDFNKIKFPKIRVCNVNPSGMLRGLPQNESFRGYSRLIRSKVDLECMGCSKVEKDIYKELHETMVSMNGYLRYLGSDKIKEQFCNGSHFLLDCTVYPSEADCSGVGTINVEISPQYLVCLYLDFPIGMRVESVSMTFYIDSFNNGATKYMVKKQWAIRLSGIVYDVLEQEFGATGVLHSKSAPPGMETTVHIHQ